MKRIYACVTLCVSMVLGGLFFSPGVFETKASEVHVNNPLTSLTGTLWVQSPRENKLAFILGVESVVAVEYTVAEKFLALADKPTTKSDIVQEMSLFPQYWITVFENVTRESIVNKIDAWYVDNEAQWDRPVFDVLWYEIMEPVLVKAKVR